MFLFVGELDYIFISKSSQIVHLNDGLEDWETVLDVGKVVVPVDVDSMDLDFIARASHINEIVQHEDLLLTGYSTRWHSSWSLLNSQLLIVTIDGLHFVDSVGSASVAHDTLGQTLLGLLRVRVKDRSLDVATLAAEVHARILGEHLRALGHHATELDQCVQMHLAQLTKFVLDGELANTHENLLMRLRVVSVNFLHDLASHSVQDRQHVRGLLCKPNGKCGLL